MARYIFDIETNGFLENVTQLHCVTSLDLDTGDIRQSSSRDRADMLAHCRELEQADEIIGHNVIKYDVPVLDKLVGFKPKGKVTDTLVMTRLIWADIADSDFNRVRAGKLPSRATGSHSLEAWGYRLGQMKGEFGKDANGKTIEGIWDHLTDEMLTYNVQDVVVNKALWDRIVEKEVDPRAVELEHRFATIIAMQERHGFAFDEGKAMELYSKLAQRRTEIGQELKQAFPPRWVPIEEKTFSRTARYWIDTPLGAISRFDKKLNRWRTGCYELREMGSTYTSIEWKEFNPSSRQQIGERLKEFGWVPTEFTANGQPKVDETTLEKLDHPAAKLLAEFFLVEKRIGQLAEGDQAWLKLVRKGRIHGSVNTNGAVTGRCTHSNPNVAQVPRVGSPFGAECRSLFGAGPGRVLVGADLSGLELRCLAHYMARYDGGAYGKVILEGDIHTVNQQAAGLPNRNAAKTFIYAFLYGAGDVKIGSIVLPTGTEEEMRQLGGKLRRSFLKKIPALGKLVKAVKQAAEKGSIKGLDGRSLKIRSPHAALNTLLQSAGALIAKQATIFAYEELSTRGYVFGKDWALVAHVHDELQVEARKEIADEVGHILVDAMRRAGEFFNFRMPIGGEFKLGANWAETH